METTNETVNHSEFSTPEFRKVVEIRVDNKRNRIIMQYIVQPFCLVATNQAINSQLLITSY